MSDPLSILVEHVAGTLPDSISKRLVVLTALRHVMKPTHPAFHQIGAQIKALAAVNRFQEELPLLFKEVQ